VSTLAGYFGIFSALLVIIVTKYGLSKIKEEGAIWDKETIEATDYTIEIHFNEAQKKEWKYLSQQHIGNNGGSWGLAFE